MNQDAGSSKNYNSKRKEINEINDSFASVEKKLEKIYSLLEVLSDKIDNIEDKMDKVEKNKPKKLKYDVIQRWKEEIRNGCKYLEVVGIEGEADFFCKKTNNVCNMLSCPLNVDEQNESNK